MARGNDLLATIEAIHAAGLDEQRWPIALGAIVRLIGGNAATLEVHGKNPLQVREFHQFGLPTAAEMAYVEHYAAQNVRLDHHVKGRLCETFWDYRILDEREMNRNAFYEFIRSVGFRYFISEIVGVSEHEFAAFSVQRSPKQGHADRGAIELFSRLGPHVRQAYDVTRRLRGAGEARSSLERALDWLADGVALVRADGAIVYANEAFQTIARRDDGIRVRKGAIEFADVDAHARFDTAVGNVARLRAGDTKRFGIDFHVVRASGALPYFISVRPLLDRKRVESPAVAIVFVRDPSSRSLAALRVLREVFGLTEAEAALAQALQSGMPSGEYARAHAVSLNTVYTHLRRIKEKTGCHRMAELIRKLNDLQVPLRLE